MEKIKWYGIATCVWIFIFPVTGICGWAFMVSGLLAIVLSIIKFFTRVLGLDITWLENAGFNLGAFSELIISIIVGGILTLVGMWLWKITKRLYKWLSLTKPTNISAGLWKIFLIYGLGQDKLSDRNKTHKER